MTDSQNSARQQRLRAALRENLKRRKGQIRGRAASEGAVEIADPPPEAAENQQDIGAMREKSQGDR